jgi:hypothetical protein
MDNQLGDTVTEQKRMKVADYITKQHFRRDSINWYHLNGRAFIDVWDAEFGLKPIEVEKR